MAPMTEYNNRCPSPPSDYEQEEENEDLLGTYSKFEIIRLLLKTQAQGLQTLFNNSSKIKSS